MSTPRNPVGWFEIYVQDMERAKTFYQKTFEQTLESLGDPNNDSGGPAVEMWNFPMIPDSPDCPGGQAPGCPGALVKMEGKDSGIGGTIVYFSCLDCATVASRALEAGGTMQLEKMSIGEYGFISLVLDTEGNMIGLHSMA